MWKGIFDEIASAVTGRRVIQFETTASVPYNVIQYLESVGVLVRPGQAWGAGEDTAHCNILVRDTQYDYAAGLIAGRPDCRLVDPPHGSVKPIAPRTRWGSPAHAGGIFTGICRTVAGGVGVTTRTPPVKQAQPPTNKLYKPKVYKVEA
jgi:hypothetical protein